MGEHIADDYLEYGLTLVDAVTPKQHCLPASSTVLLSKPTDLRENPVARQKRGDAS